MELKTVIIIGATGLVGSELLNLLLDDDSIGKVITLGRSKPVVISPKLESHTVNFDDVDSYHHLINGDSVFLCLGTTLKKAGSVNAQKKVDVVYQLNVAQAAADNKVSQVLLVSSSGANEGSSNNYLKMKGELEKAIHNLPFNRFVILRPSLLLGDRKETRVGETIASFILPIIQYIPILKKYRPIPATTVAEKLQKASKADCHLNQIFELDEIFN